MENTITVKGKMDFMEKEIPVVSGGFGEGKMCITDKTVAEIHSMTTYHVRSRINENIKHFNNGIDFIDLKALYQVNSSQKAIHGVDSSKKGIHGVDSLLKQLGFTTQSIAQAEHIYLLSERGYLKLIKIMNTDKAWSIYEELLDSYFHMREEKEEQMKMETNETMKVDFTFGEAVAEIYALTGHNWGKTSAYVNAILNGKQEDVQEDVIANEKTHWSYTEIVKEKLTNVNKAQLLQILRDNGVINEIGSTAPKPEFVKKGWYEKIFLKTYYIGEEPYGERYDWRVTNKGLEEIIKMVEAHSK